MPTIVWEPLLCDVTFSLMSPLSECILHPCLVLSLGDKYGGKKQPLSSSYLQLLKSKTNTSFFVSRSCVCTWREHILIARESLKDRGGQRSAAPLLPSLTSTLPPSWDNQVHWRIFQRPQLPLSKFSKHPLSKWTPGEKWICNRIISPSTPADCNRFVCKGCQNQNW